MKKFIRNTHTFAFLQGLYECHLWSDAEGRTHPTDDDWNRAYDRGMNVADWLNGRTTAH